MPKTQNSYERYRELRTEIEEVYKHISVESERFKCGPSHVSGAYIQIKATTQVRGCSLSNITLDEAVILIKFLQNFYGLE